MFNKMIENLCRYVRYANALFRGHSPLVELDAAKELFVMEEGIFSLHAAINNYNTLI